MWVEFSFINVGLIHTWKRKFHNISDENIVSYLDNKKFPFNITTKHIKWKQIK